jgi:hypothetical protein
MSRSKYITAQCLRVYNNNTYIKKNLISKESFLSVDVCRVMNQAFSESFHYSRPEHKPFFL